MKKLISLLLCVCLITLSMPLALAKTTVDLSQISGNTDLYEIEYDSDQDVAFVTSTIEPVYRSFTHEDENPNYYSTLSTDLLIHDYYSSSPYAVMRTWINYFGTEYIYPTSVTFTIQGTDYTFSGIGDKDWSVEVENGGTFEQMLIIYGDSDDYTSFMSAMNDWYTVLSSEDTSDDYSVTMTIHGTKDVTATLDSWGPVYDFVIMVLGMSNIGGKL